MQDTYKETAIKAAKEAGRIQLKYFESKVRKRLKDGESFVTNADVECTKAIRKIILSKFPDHNIIDEELGNMKKKSEYQWIIDPLDGTHNFIMDNPLFGVSIALQHKNEVVLGVIYLPVLKRIYYTRKGKGAFCNGKRIKVSNKKDPARFLCIYDAKLRGNTEEKIRNLGELAKMLWRFRVFGVAVYNNILVAEGKADINIDHGSNPWDHSAALLLVEEAGGTVTDFNGERWTPQTKNYVASNGKIHNKILNVLKK